MNAEEIRKHANGDWNDGSERTRALVEIAAQLAELNKTLHDMTTSPADALTRQLAVYVEGTVKQ